MTVLVIGGVRSSVGRVVTEWTCVWSCRVVVLTKRRCKRWKVVCVGGHPRHTETKRGMIMNRLFNEFAAMAINHNWIMLLVAATTLLLTITNGNHIFCRYIWFCLPSFSSLLQPLLLSTLLQWCLLLDGVDWWAGGGYARKTKNLCKSHRWVKWCAGCHCLVILSEMTMCEQIWELPFSMPAPVFISSGVASSSAAATSTPTPTSLQSICRTWWLIFSSCVPNQHSCHPWNVSLWLANVRTA